MQGKPHTFDMPEHELQKAIQQYLQLKYGATYDELIYQEVALPVIDTLGGALAVTINPKDNDAETIPH